LLRSEPAVKSVSYAGITIAKATGAPLPLAGPSIQPKEMQVLFQPVKKGEKAG